MFLEANKKKYGGTRVRPLFGGVGRWLPGRTESGHDGGWRLRLVAVANCEAADRSIGSASARPAAPGSLAGMPLSNDGGSVGRGQTREASQGSARVGTLGRCDGPRAPGRRPVAVEASPQ